MFLCVVFVYNHIECVPICLSVCVISCAIEHNRSYLLWIRSSLCVLSSVVFFFSLYQVKLFTHSNYSLNDRADSRVTRLIVITIILPIIIIMIITRAELSSTSRQTNVTRSFEWRINGWSKFTVYYQYYHYHYPFWCNHSINHSTHYSHR